MSVLAQLIVSICADCNEKIIAFSWQKESGALHHLSF